MRMEAMDSSMKWTWMLVNDEYLQPKLKMKTILLSDAHPNGISRFATHVEWVHTKKEIAIKWTTLRVSVSVWSTLCQHLRLFRHHHLDELFVVDLSIAIDVSFTDHLIDFLVGELLAEVGHDVAKLGGRNETLLWGFKILKQNFWILWQWII